MKTVEARSLSSLIDLAENPPANPRDYFQNLSGGSQGEGRGRKQEEELGQVVLYVVRVPGNRG